MPESDFIVTAHVLEHLENEREIIAGLLKKCRRLFVVVPFKESPLCAEHVRCYDESSFQDIKPESVSVTTAGETRSPLQKMYRVHLKNIIRPMFGKKKVEAKKQIVFSFAGKLTGV